MGFCTSLQPTKGDEDAPSAVLPVDPLPDELDFPLGGIFRSTRHRNRRPIPPVLDVTNVAPQRKKRRESRSRFFHLPRAVRDEETLEPLSLLCVRRFRLPTNGQSRAVASSSFFGRRSCPRPTRLSA